MTHLEESDILTSLFTYWLMLAIPWIGLTSLTTLNFGFKYFDSLYVVPIFKASLVFHNTMWGGVLLREFFIYPLFDLCMYAVGIFTIIIGILTLLLMNENQNANKSEIKSDTEMKMLQV